MRKQRTQPGHEPKRQAGGKLKKADEKKSVSYDSKSKKKAAGNPAKGNEQKRGRHQASSQSARVHSQRYAAERTEGAAESQDKLMDTADFVYGFYGVEEALQTGRGNKLFAQTDLKGRKIEALKTLAKEKAVPVQWVPKEKLDLLSDQGLHQGVVLGVTPYEYWELSALLEKVQATTKTPFFLLLDGIEDPHNLGSILRTADASGVDGVIIPKHRAVGITSVVSKTSTGAVEYVPVCRVTNLGQAVKELKTAGFWVFGTDVEGLPYTEWNTQGAIALVIGNEGKGMSPLLKKEMDEMLQIPMTGHVQSLNAGVAAGILMYEVYRKRR